jgi:hypothetical protein
MDLLSDCLHGFPCVDSGFNFKLATFEKRPLFISIKKKNTAIKLCIMFHVYLIHRGGISYHPVWKTRYQISLGLFSDCIHSFLCLESGRNLKQVKIHHNSEIYLKKIIYSHLFTFLSLNLENCVTCSFKSWRRNLFPFNIISYIPN